MNSADFKNFKLHADSTLKSMTKDELIGYIHMLHHNWGVTDEQLCNVINENKRVIANIVFDEDKLKELVDKAIKEISSIKPYKFEDLKEDMWVYDSRLKTCFLIKEINNNYEWPIVVYRNHLEDELDGLKFEKNRFFPVQMANVGCE